MKRFLWALATCMLFFLMECAQPPPPQADCGFVQNASGQRVSWKGALPIKLYFDAGFPSQYYQVVQDAANTWAAALGKKVFDLQGPIPPTTPGQDGMNVIYWMQSWDANLQQQQANTTIYWIDNRVTEADMRINAQNFTFNAYSLTPGNTNIDLQSLVLHELGHVLGLKHVDSSPSVMATYLQAGVTRRTLFPTDLTDIHCEY